MEYDLSTQLAIVALGTCANAFNGLVFALIGSLLLRYSLPLTAALCLIGSTAAALAGLTHAFVAPRLPDLRQLGGTCCLPAPGPSLEALLALLYSPLWAALGTLSFWLSRSLGPTAGLEGVKDVTLLEILFCALAGVGVVAGYVGLAFKLTGRANTWLIQNHVLDMLEWSVQMRKEEETEEILHKAELGHGYRPAFAYKQMPCPATVAEEGQDVEGDGRSGFVGQPERLGGPKAGETGILVDLK